MQKILAEGVAIGNATARSLTFRPRDEKLYFYPGQRQWYSPFAGGSSEFINNGERVLDDRIIFHYYATGITPAMARSKVGTGSAYAIGAHDSECRYYDGSNSPDIKANADGSYTVWFAPEAPEGKEGNRVQTMPGKSYNILLRLYGPLQPWFDKTWMPGDLELVK